MKKYGTVAIMGRPNTGKSTLLNTIMNQKVAITSPLPQTTRKNVSVRYEDKNGIIDFVDTPGVINKVEDLVGKRVNLEAPKALGSVDVILCLVDISRKKSDEENKVIGIIRKSEAKKIFVYNKIDKAIGSKDHLAEYNYLEDEFDEVISISALKNKNVKSLITMIMDFLKIGEPEYEKTGIKIPMTSKEFIGEIIREKAYLFLRKELPYSVCTVVNDVKDKKEMIVIKAEILTNNERYKKMIIGRGAKKIKEIGYNARKELELMSGRKIYLELKVRVDKHWMESLL